jgi:hypothetical protein
MSPRSADAAGDPSPARRARPTPATGGFVILDKAWAERLGIQRVSGVYRISRRELAAGGNAAAGLARALNPAGRPGRAAGRSGPPRVSHPPGRIPLTELWIATHGG